MIEIEHTALMPAGEKNGPLQFSVQSHHTTGGELDEVTVVCGSGREQWLAQEITDVSSQHCGVSSS